MSDIQFSDVFKLSNEIQIEENKITNGKIIYCEQRNFE